MSIQPSPAEADAIQQSYRRRRNIMRGLLAVVLLVWLGLVGAMMSDVQMRNVGFGVWIGVALVVGFASLAIWRCPRCGAPLGRTLGVDRCPHCFVALGAEPNGSHVG